MPQPASVLHGALRDAGNVLDIQLGGIDARRAQRKRVLPVFLDVGDVQRLLGRLEGVPKLPPIQRFKWIGGSCPSGVG